MDSGVLEKSYCVSRPIYSNPRLQADGQWRDHKEGKTLLEKLTKTCGCSSSDSLRMLKNSLPIIDWLSKYPIKDWLLSDVISGVSTGLVCSLQGMAYALLVSVAPVYGLYSAFFPILTYFLLGTSRHISVGPFPVTCLMVGSTVMNLVPDPPNVMGFNATQPNATVVMDNLELQRIAVASTMTVVVGLLQVAMGILQVGFLVRYLSDPLVGGFTTAAALHVFISQIKIVLSVPAGSHSGPFALFKTLIDVFNNINMTNIADLVAGLLTIATVMVVKEINAKYQHKIPVPIPIEVLVTVVAAGISYAVDLSGQYSASIVRSIPRGFEAPQAPNTGLFLDLLSSSFSTAVVGYAVAVSVAKVYAAKHDYTIDGNQELLAFGVSNILCGFFSSFVASTALSRTAVQESTGGKTQVAGIISAVLVLVVIVALGNLLEPLQKSVLAGIVIANLKGMFLQVTEVPSLWRQNRVDCFIWVVTCVSCVVLGLDIGLLAGLVFEMATVVIRTQFPSCSSLGNVPGSDVYRNLKDYKNIYEIPGVKIFRCNCPIYFANIDYFKERLRDTVGFDSVRVFKKRNKALKKIHKFIKKGKLKVSDEGMVSVVSLGVDNEAFENERDMEAGSEVEVQVDWTRDLPVSVSVPQVQIHSLVLDFSAVSFLDIVAVKSLRLVIKEFLRIDVSVYIAGCDDDLIRRMENLTLFDDVITRDLLFLTVHDAILHIKLEMFSRDEVKTKDSKEPLPFTEEEDLIETYDNQPRAIHDLSN